MGTDGDWKAVDSVKNNFVAARGHRIDFTGSSWVKMAVVKGGGKIDEVEVFDISNGNDDTWLFLGTGITADAFKGPVKTKAFDAYVDYYVKDFCPNATPAFIRGGIGCATMAGMAADLGKIMDVAGNVRFFAVEAGTEDARGGNTENLKSFTEGLQKLITSCKARNIHPIIARPPATDSAKATWQIGKGYLAAIDELVKKNGLVPGPDLYTWFLKHPEELKDDGIHPTIEGGASIQRFWAEAVYQLYASPDAPVSPAAGSHKVAPASKRKVVHKKKPASTGK
jgi:lysophospholipase L1-like esterase